MIQIRNKSADDRSQIQSVVERATSDLRLVYKPKRHSDRKASDAEIETVVAVVGGRVVGVVDFLTGSDSLFVQGLAVDPAYRRLGVGRSLVAHIEQAALRRGQSRLDLRTIRETGNPSIFARLGFITIEEKPAERFEGPQGEPVTEVSMRRVLI